MVQVIACYHPYLGRCDDVMNLKGGRKSGPGLGEKYHQSAKKTCMGEQDLRTRLMLESMLIWMYFQSNSMPRAPTQRGMQLNKAKGGILQYSETLGTQNLSPHPPEPP